MLAELKALLKSPKLWITIIGVSLIPALYNLIFLSSMWNPYGNVKHLPVAVVNKDKSASFQNKTLNIGHDMVDNMSKNKNLDYHFVTENEAQKGIEDGDYYMVITLFYFFLFFRLVCGNAGRMGCIYDREACRMRRTGKSCLNGLDWEKYRDSAVLHFSALSV